MIIDVLTQLANAASVGAPNNSTVNIGDNIDLLGGLAAGSFATGENRDIGNGQIVYAIIIVTTALSDAGVTSVSFQISSDSVTPNATDGTQTVHVRTGEYDAGQFTLGKTFCIPLPAGDVATQVGAPGTYERYLQLQIKNSLAVAVSGGAVTCFLSLDPKGNITYADAVN